MIILTRLGCGLPIAVNPDRIERAEHTPDTVITLVDGHKLVVEEPIEDVVSMVRSWHASVAAEATILARELEDTVRRTPIDDGGFNPVANATQAAGPAKTHSSDGTDPDDTEPSGAGRGSALGQVLQLPAREV